MIKLRQYNTMCTRQSSYFLTKVAQIFGYFGKCHFLSKKHCQNLATFQSNFGYFYSSHTVRDPVQLIGRCFNGIFIAKPTYPKLIRAATFKTFLKLKLWVAAIAPWFRLRLPSCGPRFESEAHHLRFFQFELLTL